MACSFQYSIMLLSIFLITISAFAVKNGTDSNSDVDDEEYPSDTHGGAEKAFSQLVSDETGGGLIPKQEDDADETQVDDEDELTSLKLEGFDDLADSESMETQYIIEEMYGYTYDEAVDSDIMDDDERK